MDPTKPTHDIVIVGAGPVGLTLGLILHAYGQKPVILERHATHYPQPRAVGIYHQAVQVYQALGLHDSLFESALKDVSGQMTGWTELVGIDNNTVLLRMPFNKPLKTGERESFALHQPSLELVLEKVCKDRKITVIRSTEVVNIQDKGSRVELQAVSPEGEYNLSARFVVGCDGARSIVRQSMGVNFIDSGGIRSRWLVVDVTPKSTAFSRDWKDAFVGRQYLDWRRPRTSVPSPLERRRWEFMILPHETDEEAKDPKSVWKLLAEFGCMPENANLDKIATYKLEGKWVDKFYSGRTILAGDAAHTTPPFLGQGLNSGLRDAMNLSWRLDFALRNPDKNYQRLFQDFSDEQLGTTTKMVMAAVGLESLMCITDPEKAEIRDAILLSAPRQPPPNLEMFDKPGMFIPASDGQFSPQEGPGHHFIDDVVEIDHVQGRLFELVKFGWLILQAEDSEGDEETVSQATMQQFDKTMRATKLTIGKRGFRDTKGTFSRFFSDHGIMGVILRPDHYVYATASKAEKLEGLVQGLLSYTD